MYIIVDNNNNNNNNDNNNNIYYLCYITLAIEICACRIEQNYDYFENE